MGSYTVLTVFENTDAINEPAVLLPIIGRVSFRQIGIIVGLSVMIPLVIYSACSEFVLDSLPDPVFSFDAVNGTVQITWDVVLALAPVPAGLALGVPRPKLVPMDRLIIILIKFAVHHTSISGHVSTAKKAKKTGAKSLLAGFARKDDSIKNTKHKKRNVYSVAVTELGIPKNITITLYDNQGNPMRNRLARAYVDDDLLSSITTDSDGVMGITFVPNREGVRSLRIMVDGIKDPVVDATLDVRVR